MEAKLAEAQRAAEHAAGDQSKWQVAVTTAAEEKARLVCDFLAGMTDGFAVRMYQRLFSPGFGSIGDLVG